MPRVAALVLVLLAVAGRAEAAPITELVQEINPGPANAQPYGFAVLGPYLYFTATEPTGGTEVWRTNGTQVERWADINPGTASSYASGYTKAGDHLYFSADAGSGRELWRTDGQSTTRVANPQGAKDPSQFGVLGDQLFFVADDGATGREPYRVFGSTVERVMDIYPGLGTAEQPNSSSPLGFTEYDGHLYFSAIDGISTSSQHHGRELWRTNGSTTELVKDIFPGGGFNSNPGGFTKLGDELFFGAIDSGGSAIFRTDGTDVTRVGGKSPANLAALGDHLYFSSYDDAYGNELFRTDGGAPELVKNIHPTEGSDPGFSGYGLVPFGGRLYFEAKDATHGRELWRTDGTETGTTLVHDIFAGSDPSYPAFASGFVGLGGYAYFSAVDADHGSELWRTNGTVTELVADINTGAPGSSPMQLTRFGDHLYFMATKAGQGSELWRVGEPGGVEGPHDSPTCSDGVDNDEDGAVDLDDSDCRLPDEDGVSDAIENGVPNGGDGNGDGTPDSQQAHVTSLPNAATGTYVTLSAPAGTALANVAASAPAANPPAGFPLGVVSFTVTGLTPGAAVTVTLKDHSGTTFAKYYKYGPEPLFTGDHWYEFAFDGTTGAVLAPGTVTLHLVDGQRGDADLAADGSIRDPGGPALETPVVTPTATATAIATPVSTATPVTTVPPTPDRTAPKTTVKVKRLKRKRVRITLAATDAGSGVARITYRIGKGKPKTYRKPFTIKAKQLKKLRFGAIDRAGNEERRRRP